MDIIGDCILMKKLMLKICEEFVCLQEQLKQVEICDVECIGCIVLKVGFGEIEIDDVDFQVVFEDVVKWFCGINVGLNGKGKIVVGVIGILLVMLFSVSVVMSQVGEV